MGDQHAAVASGESGSQAPAQAAPGPLVIRGDAGLEGKPVDHAGDVHITGNICHGITVRAGGDLRVDGAIELATVTAGRALVAAGNITGRAKGRYTAGTTLSCRSANSAYLEAGDDIECAVELVNCQVACRGCLRAERAALLGGRITANGGLVCSTLGSPGGSDMTVEAGLDEVLLALVAERAPGIESAYQRTAKIKAQIEPLMARMRSLTPKQRETATELLYQAGELKTKNDLLVNGLRETLNRSLAKAVPEVTVHGLIHPGVLIRFRNVEMKVDRTIKGPVKFMLAGKPGSTKMIATDLRTGAVTLLPFKRVSNQRMTTLLNLVSAKNDAEAA